MRIKEFTIHDVTADDNGIATTFQPAAGVALTLLVTTFDPPREIEIVSAGNISGTVFTIVGRDRNGNLLTETLTGPNAATVRSKGVYATLVSITSSATVAVNATVGWGSRVPGPWMLVDTAAADSDIPQPSIYVTAFEGASDFAIETTNEHLSVGPGDITTDAVVSVADNAVASGVTEKAPAFEQAAYFRVVKTSTDAFGIRVRVARPRF